MNIKRFITGFSKYFLPDFFLEVFGIVLVVFMGGIQMKADGQKYFSTDTALINKLIQDAHDTFDIDPQRALVIAQMVVDNSEKIDYKAGMAEGYLDFGVFYSKTGSPGKANEYLEKALRITKPYHLKKVEGEVLNEKGSASEYEGDYNAAFSYFSDALNINKAINDSAAIAYSYRRIGHCFSIQDNFDEALKNLSQAMDIYKSLHMPHDIAGLCTNFSALYFNHNDYKQGLNYLYKAINIYNNLHDPNALSNPYNQLATYFQKTNHYDSAAYYYKKSLEIAINTGSKLREADALYGLGMLNYDMGKYRVSEKYCKDAFSIAKQINYKDFLFRLPHDLALTFACMHDYKDAYEYMDTSYEMRDSMLTDEKEKAIGEMQVRFDVIELDSKNKLLQKENDLKQASLQRKNIIAYSGFGASMLFLIIGLLMVRQNKLTASQQKMELEQKQLLAQINPHFIFNCLNSIQQFVVQKDIINANKYLADFAMLMRQTLDNSKDGSISLRREIEYLENYLSFEHMRFEDKFSYTVQFAPDINIDTTCIPSMVIQPFVENAIRHGLCNLEARKGILNISFYKKERFLYCEVDDNGIGMEESQKLKEQTFIKYQSHGMELTRQRLALVSKMHSEDYSITLISKKDGGHHPIGTTIILKFPLQA